LELNAVDLARHEVRRLAFVEVAFVVAEGPLEERLLDGFDVAVRAEVLAVDGDVREITAGRRQTGALEQAVRQTLAGVRWILPVIVQGEARKARWGLARHVIKVELERRPQARERPQETLLAHGHAFETAAVDADGGGE